jgi:hypothetical protein
VLCEFRSRLVEGHAQQRMPGSAAEALSGGGMAQSSWTAAHGLDPCVSQDRRTQSHVVRRADHALRVTCPGGSGPGVGSCLCAH